jgi:hypothetical protein
MRQPSRSGLAVALIMSALLLILAPPAPAHVREVVGRFRLTFGWREEPAFTGSKNFVEVAVADAAGAPVSDLGGPLTAEVSFGDRLISLPLLPAEGQPGQFRASLVPTRPGTYSFHITGRVKGQAIDTRATCSQRTFDCVADVSAVEFPAKDPSTGQLAQRLERALPRAEGARDTAGGAHDIAIGAIAVAALALGAAIGLGVRWGRKST